VGVTSKRREEASKLLSRVAKKLNSPRLSALAYRVRLMHSHESKRQLMT